MKAFSLLQWILISTIMFSSALHAANQAAVISGGETGCTVERIEDGTLNKRKALLQMALYPGDILRKPGNIKSVIIDYRPDARPEFLDRSSLIIRFTPAKIPKFLSKKLKEWFEMVELFDVSSAARGRGERLCLPGNNSTVVPGQEIFFSNCCEAGTMRMKKQNGKEIFSKKIEGRGVWLTPEQIGLKSPGQYIWQLTRGKNILFQSQITLLSAKDWKTVEKEMTTIRKQKKTNPEIKRLKRAALCQFVSDYYPGTFDLYWLSNQILKNGLTNDKTLMERFTTLKYRCLDHFNAGIRQRDLEVLDSPGCVVTLHRETQAQKSYVSPNTTFFKDQEVTFHFQTNFPAYALILYLGKKESVMVFPGDSQVYHIEPGSGRFSYPCVFEEKADEKFLFILSKKEIPEMEHILLLKDKTAKTRLISQLSKRVQKQDFRLNVLFSGKNAYVQPSLGQLRGVAWFKLTLENKGRQ